MKDSIQTATLPSATARHPERQAFNPKQIIESLPADATPAQQDSAIQAQLPQREKIRSECPDTLNLPGWNIPSNQDASPVFKLDRLENFFSHSPYYHPEQPCHPQGMTSDPIPYTLRNDHLITGLLLLCFFVTAHIFAHNKKTIKQYLQDFFLHKINRERSFSVETGQEVRSTVFLYLQAGLLAGIFFFGYTQMTRDLFMLRIPPYALLGIYIFICWAYIGIKQMAYLFINWIFFDKKERNIWFKSYVLLMAAEGVLLFPAALTAVFFNLSPHFTILCPFLIISFLKLLLFQKTFCYFFPTIHGIPHLIVYFCTFEILPIFYLWQTLTQINDILL